MAHAHLIVDGNKGAVGYSSFKKKINNKKLTRKESMDAFCFECMGGFADEIADCQCYECPMYEHFHYRHGKSLSKRRTQSAIKSKLKKAS